MEVDKKMDRTFFAPADQNTGQNAEVRKLVFWLLALAGSVLVVLFV